MRSISVLNFKGGVGKSTLATNLGHALALRGVPVLIIDCDLQANASTLLPEPTTPTLTDVLMGRAALPEAIRQAREDLWIVPADKNLDQAAKHVSSEGMRGYYRLRKGIERAHDFDVILFDHSPSYSAVTEAALLASTEMLVPCELAAFAIEGLLQMFEKLEDTLVEHTLTLSGIVPFKLDRRIKMHLSYLNDLKETFGEKILPAIRTDSVVGRAQSRHQTVFEYDDTSKAAEDFRLLADAVTGERVGAAV